MFVDVDLNVRVETSQLALHSGVEGLVHQANLV
jgi:hypothetical protein